MKSAFEIDSQSANGSAVFRRSQTRDRYKIGVIVLHDTFSPPAYFKGIGFNENINCSSEFSHRIEHLIEKMYPSFPKVEDPLGKVWTSEGNRVYMFECDDNICGNDFRKTIINENAKLAEWVIKKSIEIKEFQETSNRKKKEEDEIAQARREAGLKAISTADMSDVVAKVLNYSDGCDDEGCDTKLWIKEKGTQCTYSSFHRKTGEKLRSIDLNKFDPKNIKVGIFARTGPSPDLFGPNRSATISFNTYDVLYEGKQLFSARDLDTSRLNRGWELIYSKYCKGMSKEF